MSLHFVKLFLFAFLFFGLRSILRLVILSQFTLLFLQLLLFVSDLVHRHAILHVCKRYWHFLLRWLRLIPPQLIVEFLPWPWHPRRVRIVMVDMEHWHIVLPTPPLGLSESIRHIVGGTVAVCLKFVKPKQVQVLVLVVIE